MPPKSKLAACINCRQMKLKCDTHELFPGRCTRCEKRNLRCSIDPSFRRTAKRERLKALEKEVERLQNTSSTGDSPDDPPETTPDNPEPSTHHVAAPSSDGEFHTSFVGDIEIGELAILELFQVYYENFQVTFPMLSDWESAVHWYNTCPLLLGTILSIASGHKVEYSWLRDKLIPEVQRLAVDTLEAVRNPVLTVQALLLLAWWPLRLDATILNPGWAYCGFATHTALQFGLHRSHYPSDFRYGEPPSDEARNSRKRTWLACFVVNQSVSSFLGIPATIPIDHTIVTAIGTQDATLPLILRQYLAVAYQEYQINQALGNNLSTPSGATPDPSALIPSYDRNLHALNLRHSLDWSNVTEIAFLKTRLNLHMFAFCKLFGSDAPTIGGDTFDTTVIVEAERCAERIIKLAAEEYENVHQWCSDVRGAITGSIFFLLKLLASKHAAMNQTQVTESIRQAWNIFRKASTNNTDHFARVCHIIEFLTGAGRSATYATTISMKSRMASNLLFDTAWTARSRFPAHIREMRVLDYTAAAAAQGQQDQINFETYAGELQVDLDLMASTFGGDLGEWDLNQLVSDYLARTT